MSNKKDKHSRDLEIFEAVLDAFILPDGRPLRALLTSGDPGTDSLSSVYFHLEQGDMDAAIMAQYGAVKELALSKNWDVGKLTADLIMQELIIRQAFLDDMLRKTDKDSNTPLH